LVLLPLPYSIRTQPGPIRAAISALAVRMIRSSTRVG